MMRRLDRVWYELLCMANNWIFNRVEAYCRRYEARGAKAKDRRDAAARLEQELARQKPELN